MEVCNVKRESRESRCPMCLETFPETVIHQHAAECGEEKGSSLKEKQTAAKSLEEDMELILQKIEKRKDVWTVHIVRRRFMQTASEELNDASEEDWEKPFRINFIGEEGLDSGGLRREFFTLLFKQTTIFEGCSFCLDSNLLAQKQYKLIGKATAIAIINGHPGPCRFNKFIAEYIVTGKEPDAREISKGDIDRADVVNLLNELESPQDLASVPDRFSELLQDSGFRKILTEHNKEEALAAVKCHFVFYEKLGPLLQFMEGLRLHGVLQALQRHFEEGLKVFTVCKYPLAAEIAQFFIPRYSREEEKKAMEEIAVYNFNKFLKMVERGSVSTMAGDLENDDMQMKTLTTADVVRAFLGSDSLPRSVTSGMIEFNHSKNLSTVNTCAPSLTLSNVAMLQSYETFESHMIYVIVGAPDFGIA